MGVIIFLQLGGGFICFVLGEFMVRWGGVEHHWSAMPCLRISLWCFGKRNPPNSLPSGVHSRFLRKPFWLGGVCRFYATDNSLVYSFLRFYPLHEGEVGGGFGVPAVLVLAT